MRRTVPVSLTAIGVAIAVFALVVGGLAGTTIAHGGDAVEPADPSTDEVVGVDRPTLESVSDSQRQSAQEGNVSPGSTITFEGDETRSGTTMIRPDAGAVTASGLATIDARYNQRLLDHRLDNATTDAERRSDLRRQQTRLERRVLALRASEMAAYRSYVSGDLNDQSVAYELARIHGTAQAYEAWGRHLQQRTEETAGISPGPTTGASIVDAAVMQGPVRDRAATAASGGSDGVFYVTVARNGYVLGTNTDGQYIREAYHDDRYQRDAAIEIDEVEALDRVDEQYPWLTEFPDVERTRSFQTPSVGGSAYRISVRHPYGDLTTYVNTASGEVFAERQRLDHGRIPTDETANATENGLRLVVNRTFPTGPATVRLVDATSGEPLQGTIRIDNRTVGTIDQGVAWIVLPADRTELTAVVGVNEVSVTVGESSGGSEQSGAADDTGDQTGDAADG